MSKNSSDNSIYGIGRSGILWYFLEGSKKYFLLSILCSIVTSFLDLISPRLVGVTVDLITGEFHEDSSAVLRALLTKLAVPPTCGNTWRSSPWWSSSLR